MLQSHLMPLGFLAAAVPATKQHGEWQSVEFFGQVRKGEVQPFSPVPKAAQNLTSSAPGYPLRPYTDD